MATGLEYDYNSSDLEAHGDNSDTQSKEYDDDVIPETQDHGFDPTNNGERVLNIFSRLWLNFFNNATITAYFL